jgi:hypothetical protein
MYPPPDWLSCPRKATNLKVTTIIIMLTNTITITDTGDSEVSFVVSSLPILTMPRIRSTRP